MGGFFAVVIGGLVISYVLGVIASDNGPPKKLEMECPHCQRRSVETAREIKIIRGLLIAVRFGSMRVIGCQPCVTQQVRQLALSNLLLGWWSIIGFFLTYFYLLQNVFNLSDRPDTKCLKKTLREVGLSYDDFVLDKDGLSRAHRRLLKTAASVLSKVAAVEGKNSFEWNRAEEILVSLSDDRISLSRSRYLLEQEDGVGISRTGLDEEQCLVLIVS